MNGKTTDTQTYPTKIDSPATQPTTLKAEDVKKLEALMEELASKKDAAQEMANKPVTRPM